MRASEHGAVGILYELSLPHKSLELSAGNMYQSAQPKTQKIYKGWDYTMPLVLNPKYRMTKQKSSIILHNTRLAGSVGYVQSISSTEAIILALCDGTRRPADLSKALAESSGFTEEDIHNVMTILQDYVNQSVLMDPNILENRSQLQAYNPLDFAFDAEVKPIGARLDQPIGLTYLPTLSCNRFCKYCYANANYLKNEERIPLYRLVRIIDEASDLGVRTINISGGEPFLRQDLTEILECMLNKDIYPTVSTKTALSENIVRRLSRAGLEDIQVSLDSSVPEIANFLTGTENYYQEIVNTIQLLVKYEIKVNLSCVLTSFNIKQVPSLLNLATNIGVSHVALSPYTSSLGRHEDDLFPSPKDKRWLALILPRLEGEYPRLKISGLSPSKTRKFSEEDTLPHGLTCTIGTYGFILLPNGEVSVCERLAYDRTFIMGDLNNESIMEVWSSPKWGSFCYPDRELYEGTECFRCEDFERCTRLKRRCVVRTRLVYGKVFGPEPSCPRIQNPDVRLV